MRQYLLSVITPTDGVQPPPEALAVIMKDLEVFHQELRSAGAWVFAGGLFSNSSATVVRSTDGDVSMTDGPYAESKEQMGGFWVIKAADLDAALDWAGQATVACGAPVEVRPFHGE